MKIAFAGDWHGNHRYTMKALDFAGKNGADVVIHVGDFGIWAPHESFINTVNYTAERHGLQVFFVDGNHEDHPWLNAQPVRSDGFRELAPNVAHIPRGTVWEWDGVTFMGLGGAHSVDRQWRTPNVDWFSEEALTYGQAFAAGSNPANIDVMVTHDCPTGVEIPSIAQNIHGFPQEELNSAESHRGLLGSVVDSVKPRYLIHGHYHVAYTAQRGPTTVIGLDCDGRPLSDNVRVEDTKNLRR